MATTAGNGTEQRDRGRTPAQWYCLLAGAALLLAGIAGFFVDSGFDTGGTIDGDALLGFEVNGFHNLVHLASGVLLLASSAKRVSAKTVALLFGVVYGVVTLIGLIDGDTILGLLPVNPADNVLHLALALTGILAAVASDADDRDRRAERTAAPRSSAATRFERDSSDVDPLTGRPRSERVR
jgi:hypothetical protein